MAQRLEFDVAVVGQPFTEIRIGREEAFQRRLGVGAGEDDAADARALRSGTQDQTLVDAGLDVRAMRSTAFFDPRQRHAVAEFDEKMFHGARSGGDGCAVYRCMRRDGSLVDGVRPPTTEHLTGAGRLTRC